MYSDPLIYGKNKLERIVSLEVDGQSLEVFVQEPNGKISSHLLSNRYWLLSPRKIDSSWVKLKGSLYYQYGKQYTDREEFVKDRSRLRKADVYSIFDPKEAIMVKDGYTYYKALQPKEVSILSFDIETTGISHNDESKILLISNSFRDHLGNVSRRLFSFDEYENEGNMLNDWCEWVRESNPSIVCGHNIFSYDLPYMQYIADRTGVTLDLGRDGSPIKFNSYSSAFRIDGSREQEYKKVHIYGRELVDTMFLAIKYDTASKKYESYGLKNIVKQEGLEIKDRVFYDASKIRDNYKDPIEFAKIKAYAIHDADDALALYDLMVPAYFFWGQSVPKPFQMIVEGATGSQINSMMVRAYLQNAHSVSKASEIEPFEGGISFGIPGVYSNCWKLDIKSAYPSSILVYELYDKEKDPEAIMLKLCKFFTYKRFDYKKKFKETNDPQWQALDAAAKICINSIFGFCGAAGLNYNSPQTAAKITAATRDFLNTCMKWGTGKGKEYWLSDDRRNL